MLNTINEVYDYLYNQRKTSKRDNLDRIKKAYEMLNLKMNYKIIHVAGTNGKGSVCVSIKNILESMGKKVGMFVSPYVISFNERIQINDRFISNAEILHYANILEKLNEKYYELYNDKLPFFELTFLMCLMYFQDRKIDFAVIECGLGGLLDSTNFINADLSIITNIGFDHKEQLGSTRKEILNHKIGIVKENNTLITLYDHRLHNKIEEYIKNKNAKLIYVDKIKNIKVKDKTMFNYKGLNYETILLGDYQAYNLALAIEAVNYFYPNTDNNLINYAALNIIWPGRFETLSKKPYIIIDGAHNPSAILKLVSTIKKYFSEYKIKILFSALKDKEYDKMIYELDKIASYYYFTHINDLRSDYNINYQKYTDKDSVIIDNDHKSIKKIIKEIKKDELLLVTGSLHFISEERNIILDILNEK